MSTQVISDQSTTGHLSEPSEADLRYGIFVELDSRAREIESLFKSTWVELADICISMRDSEYWREGKYTSYNSWLISALPCSRSWAYLAVGVREELKEIAGEDLQQMPLQNAEVLRKLPRKARSSPSVIESAQTLTPNEFLPHIAAAQPEMALEAKIKRYRVYTVSQLNKIDEGMNLWRKLNPGSPLSDADIEEYQWVEYINEHQDQEPEAGLSGDSPNP